jgi:hypothetical protein
MRTVGKNNFKKPETLKGYLNLFFFINNENLIGSLKWLRTAQHW